MPPPLHLCYLFPSLDMGGPVKSLLSVLRRQLAWARITAGSKSSVIGPLTQTYLSSGLATPLHLNDQQNLKAWINATRPDVVILHRSGNCNEADTAILRTLHAADIPCFEINIFGRRDSTSDGLWAGHFHVSRWSMLRYAERLGSDPLTLKAHLPLGYAVEPMEPFSHEERLAARESLGIEPRAFVAARLLRPDLRKWDPLPVFAMKQFARIQPESVFLVREAPQANGAWMSRQLGKHVRHLPMTRNKEEFRQTLAAADCLLNYSGIGESFGVAIVEGMAAGLPIVTNSQPMLDNAQVEHCEHEVTGLVANSITGLARALERLANDEPFRVALGNRARDYASQYFSAEKIDSRIRRFLRERLSALGDERADLIPAPPSDEDDYRLTQEWIADFRRREQARHEANLQDSLGDRMALTAVRLRNQFGHASNLGWGNAARVVLRRLGRGRLTRE